MLVLVLNVGSSSLKGAVFDTDADDPRRVVAATVTKRGGETVATITSAHDSRTREDLVDAGGGATRWLLTRLERDGFLTGLAAVGHRLVHGGMRYRQPVWLTGGVVVDLRRLIPLAPDHLPVEIESIDAVATHWPHIRQAACFDTAFHHDLPRRARLFGLPRRFADSGVVRFGFHGLSYEYVVREAKHLARSARGQLLPIWAAGPALRPFATAAALTRRWVSRRRAAS